MFRGLPTLSRRSGVKTRMTMGSTTSASRDYASRSSFENVPTAMFTLFRCFTEVLGRATRGPVGMLCRGLSNLFKAFFEGPSKPHSQSLRAFRLAGSRGSSEDFGSLRVPFGKPARTETGTGVSLSFPGAPWGVLWHPGFDSGVSGRSSGAPESPWACLGFAASQRFAATQRVCQQGSPTRLFQISKASLKATV